MTEDEAKTRPCAADPKARCVGFMCMAWRWQNTPIGMRGYFETLHEDGSISNNPDRLGFCGLAGRP